MNDDYIESNDDNIEKQKPVEEIFIPPEKRGNTKQTEKSIIKMKHFKYLNY